MQNQLDSSYIGKLSAVDRTILFALCRTKAAHLQTFDPFEHTSVLAELVTSLNITHDEFRRAKIDEIRNMMTTLDETGSRELSVGCDECTTGQEAAQRGHLKCLQSYYRWHVQHVSLDCPDCECDKQSPAITALEHDHFDCAILAFQHTRCERIYLSAHHYILRNIMSSDEPHRWIDFFKRFMTETHCDTFKSCSGWGCGSREGKNYQLAIEEFDRMGYGPTIDEWNEISEDEAHVRIANKTIKRPYPWLCHWGMYEIVYSSIVQEFFKGLPH